MALGIIGDISLFQISKELTHNDPNNSIPPPNSGGTNYGNFFYTAISLHDMETQGGTYKVSSNYPAINTANDASNRPDGSNPNQVSEWYGYDHDKISQCLEQYGTNFSSSSSTGTACGVSAAHSGSTGSVSNSISARWIRYDVKTDGVFTFRAYRTTSFLRVRLFYDNDDSTKNNGPSTTGMTLVESMATQGYQHMSKLVSEGDHILILFDRTNSSITTSGSIDRVYVTDLSPCQYSTLTTGKLFGPTGTVNNSYSTTSNSPASLITSASYSSNNSSAWSTVYVRSCSSSNPIEEGNIVFANSGQTTKIGWNSNGSSWRVISVADTTFPISSYALRGIYNSFHNDVSNITHTYAVTS